MVHRLNRQWLAQLGLESVLGCFSLRLSRIKRSQVMSMGKFGPTAPNFFGLRQHLLLSFSGTPCRFHMSYIRLQSAAY